MKRLLLISNSTLHGSGYLDHCADEVLSLFGDAVGRVLFVPYALHDRDGYAKNARQRFDTMGYALDSIHEAEGAGGARSAVERAEAIFIGGGNTFRLLNELYENSLLGPIRERVEGGMPYMGTSAGSNVACVTIKTTNDMPIVQPPSFDALGLVPFNINAHYLDPDLDSKHMGETREQRIAEFHEMNEPPVVGLREGAMLHVEDGRVELRGSHGARLFRPGQSPTELETGARLDELMGAV